MRKRMGQDQSAEIRRLKATAEGDRLDKYLADACPDLTRTFIKRLVQSGDVSVNGSSARPALRLKPGDNIEIRLPPSGPAILLPESIPFEIIYESKDLVVINKPAGLIVYPAPGHSSHTLANALLQRYPDLEKFGGSLRPGIVHRLDRDTSGLMVVARNETARLDLVNQFKSRSVIKGYTVLVKGKITPETGAIEAPIGRDPAHRQRMAVVSTGRPARTDYRVVKYIDGCSLIEARIHTGRTHQIRVHFAAIGFPVVGDSVYGYRTDLLRRQFLHSSYLQFLSPGRGELLTFRSELPEDLNSVLRMMNTRNI